MKRIVLFIASLFVISNIACNQVMIFNHTGQSFRLGFRLSENSPYKVTNEYTKLSFDSKGEADIGGLSLKGLEGNISIDLYPA